MKIFEKWAKEIKVGDLIRSDEMIVFQKVNRIEKGGGRIDLWLDKASLCNKQHGLTKLKLFNFDRAEILQNERN